MTPLAGHDTWSVIYRLSPGDLAALDANEGFRSDRATSRNSYNRVEVVVSVDNVLTQMVTYIAVDQENPPLPNAGYLKHLRDGARHHSLPAAYLEYLEGLQHS